MELIYYLLIIDFIFIIYELNLNNKKHTYPWAYLVLLNRGGGLNPCENYKQNSYCIG